MKILILGADGYLGWPTVMNLSSAGHEIVAVDNYLRRNIAREEDCEALFEVPNLHERSQRWLEKSGKRIEVRIGDLADWDFTGEIFKEFRPDAIVHYAEQPSAPYSMKNRRTADLTFNNNLKVTFNIIQAMHEYTPQCHMVKLGTMGEYGTPNIDIEEGWLDIKHKGRSQKFLYPRQAGSLYHTTKVLDTDLLWFYVRTWGLKATDLMQGPVYGVETEENEGQENLYPFFHYDELFGTVINRFMVQAVCGYPLTVYGKGGQTRGYLNIKDTLQCVKLSIENPANNGELRIFNQFVETLSVNEIADKVKASAGRLDIDVVVNNIENPRKELEEHYYNPKHTGLLDLGLEPNYLTDDVLDEMMKLIVKYKDNIVQSRIFRGVKWDK
jgi:UDP-sulfoquinovose synthase